MLRESVTGEVVSNVTTKYLLEQHPASALKSNGRSDYPDIYLSTLDYSALPQFKRKKKVTPRGRVWCCRERQAEAAGSSP